jgi:hypothetical protein
MDRRTLLRIAAPSLALGLAGCSDDRPSGEGSDDGDGDASDMVTVDALDVPADELDDPVTSLTVEYDFQTHFMVKPDEGGALEASGEKTNLVFEFRVTNDGEEPIGVAHDMFQVADNAADSVFQRYDVEDDPDQFPDRTLDPGDVANGWVAYRIPSLDSKVLLALRQSVLDGEVAVTFQESDLESTINDEESGTTVPEEDP